MNKPLLLGLTLVSIGALLFLSFGSNVTSERDRESMAPGGTVEVVKEQSFPRVLIEAEEAHHFEFPFHPVNDILGASNGRCCYIGPERVNESEEIRNFAKGYPEAPNPGYSSYRFQVEFESSYRIWLRVKWSNSCGNSVDVVINNAFFATVQSPAGSTPEWRWVRAGSEQIPVTVRLSPGKTVELRLCNREDDLYIDQILLMDSRDHLIPHDRQFVPAAVNF